MTWPTQQGTFELSDLTLQSGIRFPSARLSWKAHGTLSATRDNVVIYPTSFGSVAEPIPDPSASPVPQEPMIVKRERFFKKRRTAEAR